MSWLRDEGPDNGTTDRAEPDDIGGRQDGQGGGRQWTGRGQTTDVTEERVLRRPRHSSTSHLGMAGQDRKTERGRFTRAGTARRVVVIYPQSGLCFMYGEGVVDL
ncbi:hypothetical protein CC2G_002886 [Coprinopsis cinerea AmutBmut pab1-1]|nr:hypothetical protein CC2G_002886 [Coprinopsis cinerea AmutBmut pab1-1]